MVKSADIPAKYTALVTLVRDQLPRLREVKPRVWTAFWRACEHSVVRAELAVGNAAGSPSLKVAELTHPLGKFVNGQFDHTEDPDTIFLNRVLAERLQASGGALRDHLLVESTVLHELVHWADFAADGKARILGGKKELGVAFETDAYGLNIGLSALADDAVVARVDRVSREGAPGPSASPLSVVSRRFAAPFAIATNSARSWPVKSGHAAVKEVSYWDGTRIHGEAHKAFGANRTSANGPNRHHAGIDLYGNEDDRVRACEDGVVVNVFRFTRNDGQHHETHAVMVQCDSGLVINYGEVKKSSLAKYGTHPGAKVRAGRTIARLGRAINTAMLHFEIYTNGTVASKRWLRNSPPPPGLLDPSHYLLQLRDPIIANEVAAGP